MNQERVFFFLATPTPPLPACTTSLSTFLSFLSSSTCLSICYRDGGAGGLRVWQVGLCPAGRGDHGAVPGEPEAQVRGDEQTRTMQGVVIMVCCTAEMILKLRTSQNGQILVYSRHPYVHSLKYE